ncbi:protein PIF [Microplitis demolitor]|uniref:protein PIF n=1 Tax=Microplitis demolitor TaxID=69319 RepID=UPI0004CD75C1|nr:protein PIF [Microplitis demolitor]
MTTMDSDSESQDSDEGRRFRFEATRKDAIVNQLHSHRRNPSPFRPNRRPGSRDRSRHDRSRSHERRKESRGDRHSDRHGSGRGRSRSSSKDPARGSKNSKEESRGRKDKDDRHREHKSVHGKESYDRRDSRSRDSRSRDPRDLKRDRRRSRDSYDRRSDKRERGRRYSRERDRHKKSQDNDRVPDAGNNGDKTSTNDNDNDNDNDDRISILSDNQDCKDLNLSDFDIVSDTEGNSHSGSSLRDRNWRAGSIDPKKSRSRSRCTSRSRSRTRLRTRSRSKSRPRSRSKSKSKSKSISRTRSKPKTSPVIVIDEIIIDDEDEDQDEEDDDDDLGQFNTDTFSDVLLGNASTSAPSICSISDNDKLKICTDLIDNLSDDDDNKNYSNLTIDDDEEDSVKILSGDDCYGPTLPPKSTAKSEVKDKNSEQKIIGPCLPDNLRKLDGDDKETFGPSLPPSLQRLDEGRAKRTIGPSLPRHLMEHLDDEDDFLMDVDVDGEVDDIDEEEGMLGPLPADHPAISSDRIQRQLEYRARLIKEELAEIDYREEKKREEWMTELPAVRAANLGLGPRKFRAKEGPDFSDRSSWTDTPADRERKQKELKMGKRPAETIDESPKEKSSKRREKSLLEMHQKKMNKKRRKEEKDAKKNKTTVRRPFDRDIDMQVNRFDDARKKSILMKAQTLDDRFSRGKI